MHYFTDAQLVLTWLNTPPHILKTFVANRVVTILELSNPQQWHHVTSQENPADCASRGLYPRQLLCHSLWFTGPAFLNDSPDMWSNEYSLFTDEDPERKEKCSFLSIKDDPNYFIDIISRYSSLSKLQRVIAYVKRYLHNLRTDVVQ